MDIDLLAMIQQDARLKKASSHRGGEWHGPCPFCGGKDRLRVQPYRNFWTCRQCGKGGDAIAYVMAKDGIGYVEALVKLGDLATATGYILEKTDFTQDEAGAILALVGDGKEYKEAMSEVAKARKTGATLPKLAALPAATSTPKTPTIPTPEACEPPSQEWQAHASDFIAVSQETLWSATGSKALAWLVARGLTEEAITRGGLGYHGGNPEYEDRAAWGLPDELNDKGNLKKVWLPRGVVIPWVIGDDVWRVNIRRPVGEPKYIGPTGWGNALYDADQLTTDRPAILVEGELDALTVKQHAGDLITPTATGSTAGARRARWLARLALCPRVLVAFDADQAGEDARQYWLSVLPNGVYWRPFWGDANGMQTGGGDLRQWIAAGLG